MIMKKKLYYREDIDDYVIVWETHRQKDILDILDELLENSKTLGWNYCFEDDTFYIEYKDGTTYYAGQFDEDGEYRKKGIAKIVYTNANDTQVFGKYEVNEYGIVF